MRLVVDTNVLVSAVLRDRNPEAVILFVIERPDFEWVASLEILTEYKSVLARDKFGLTPELLREWYEMLDTFTTVISEPDEFSFPRDQKDAKFLACAIAANADFFITGDHDFSEAIKLVKTTILSVSMFKRLVCDALS